METIREDLFKIEVKYLLDICKNLKELLTDVRLQINKEEMKIIELEPANICLIEVVLNKSNFIFLTDNAEIRNYSININGLYQLLKEQKKEIVEVSVSDNKFYLKFSNGFKSELCLIDIETEIKKFPELNLNAFFEMESKRFKEIVKNMENVSDIVLIELKEDCLKFYSEGLNKSEINLNSDEVRIKGTATAKYSLNYLKNFVKCLISDKVIFKFDTDSPIILEFMTGGFNLKYVLAPRVEEQD